MKLLEKLPATDKPKLALSSDKLYMLKMPLLNVGLDLSSNGDTKFFSVEMSKEELQTLINALEAANKFPRWEKLYTLMVDKQKM